MTEQSPKDANIAKQFASGAAIDSAMRRAAREAYRRHKQAGVPIVVWRDGRVVHLDPDTISIPEPGPDSAHQ